MRKFMLFHKNSQTFRILFQSTTLFGIKIGYHIAWGKPIYVHCKECTTGDLGCLSGEFHHHYKWLRQRNPKQGNGNSLSATYVFADTDAYYAFEEEVRALGLDDSYTVDSPDISAFENSLAPLNPLSTIAGWFLVVILIIGGVILVSHSPEVAEMCDERYELVKISGKNRRK